MTAGAHSRHEQDRLAYLSCRRAAEAMRADAAKWRELGDELIADETVYGPGAGEYRAAQIARLEVVAVWCDHEADRQAAYSLQYRDLLVGDGAEQVGA
jgi:hypothetical protein